MFSRGGGVRSQQRRRRVFGGGGGGGCRRDGASSAAFLFVILFLFCNGNNNGNGGWSVVTAIRVHDTERSPFFPSYPENPLQKRRRAAAKKPPKNPPRVDPNENKTPYYNPDTTNVSIVKLPASADEHLVTDLPLLDPADFPTRHWAGHMPVDDSELNGLFYWLFAPDTTSGKAKTVKKESDIPLIIWLQGGPGCSSMDGLFLENGPLRFVPDESSDNNNTHKIAAAEHSWHKAPAYVMYVDQPIGTGLSVVYQGVDKMDRNDTAVSSHFYFFLQKFFTVHADTMVTTDPATGVKTVKRPFYIAGESYAGHFIPAMIAAILRNNDALEPGSDAVRIPVSGGAIGNGWIDPKYQYSAAEVGYGHGLLGYAQMRALQDKERDCQEQLSWGLTWVPACRDMLDDVVENSHGEHSNTKVNMYNVRHSERADQPRDFPAGHKTIENVLGGWHHEEGGSFEDGVTDAVLTALHVRDGNWEAEQYYKECNFAPFAAIRLTEGLDVVNETVEILEHPDKVQLLFYNGMDDLVINHIGNDRALENLPWELTDKWITATRYAWKAASEDDDEVSGYMKEFANLKFLKILRSGHMVPMEVPATAFDMMQTFVYKQSFKTRPQNLARVNEPRECPATEEEEEDEELVLCTTETSHLWYSRFVAAAVSGIILMMIYRAVSYWKATKDSGKYSTLSMMTTSDIHYRDNDKEIEMQE